jgi:predicted DNA-binding protein with PD1-like motif
MHFRKESHGYWLMLEKGEEAKSSIEAWAKKEEIEGAQVWGIGAVEGAVLGSFDVKTGNYEWREFPGSYELLSCIGNISRDGFHAHLSISSDDFIVKGGHLKSATISVFGEFFILPTSPLGKIPAPEFGLRKIRL